MFCTLFNPLMPPPPLTVALASPHLSATCSARRSLTSSAQHAAPPTSAQHEGHAKLLPPESAQHEHAPPPQRNMNMLSGSLLSAAEDSSLPVHLADPPPHEDTAAQPQIPQPAHSLERCHWPLWIGSWNGTSIDGQSLPRQSLISMFSCHGGSPRVVVYITRVWQ